MTPETWQMLEKAGIVSLLIFNVYLYVHGDIFSKAAVDKMLQVGDKRAEIMAKKLTDAMSDGIREAVAMGVLEAVSKIHEMAPVTKELKKNLKKNKNK